MTKNSTENKHTREATLQAARELEKRGFWVVWCAEGKDCYLKGWPNTRRNLAELETALRLNPNLNIAVVLNQSNFIDVECDSAEAEAAFLSMCDGRVPRTPTWKSKRGLHRLFRRPEGMPNKAKVVIDLIEFRGLDKELGALSIVPPSRGREWVKGLTLDDIEPAELPAQIAQRLRSMNTGEPTEPAALEDGEIPEGERNDRLFKIACNMLRAKLSEGDVSVSLWAINRIRCKPPLPDAEVQGIVKSACTLCTLRPLSHGQILMGLALKSCELWQTPDGKAFATIRRDGHREHWPVRNSTYKQWLSCQFYRSEGSVIGSQTLADVVNTLEGKALFDGPTHSVFLRIAGDEDYIYIDLADPDWKVVEVGKDGWRVLGRSPIRFRRTKGMLPLPPPERGGSITTLRKYVNLSSDGWYLLIGWVLSALRPASTYPILKLVGEQGATKSTLTKVVRSLIDPSTDPLLEPPRSREDLMVLANSSWLLPFDNLSYISQEMSDSYCRLSTGGSMGKRRNYTDDELHTLSATRPLLFNGIEDPGTRSDLMDRCVNVELLALDENKRKSDVEFWAEFEKVRPLIFGSLLDLLSLALRRVPEVRAKKKPWPRMADFCQWAEAAFESKPGYHFCNAYRDSQAASHRLALESTPLTPKLLHLLESEGGTIDMTATELHERLESTCRFLHGDTRQKGWPKTPKVLSGLLGRMGPNLRGIGLKVSQYEKAKGDGTKNKEKYWLIVDPKRSPQRPQECSQNLAAETEYEPDPPRPPEQEYSPIDFGTVQEG